jgi:dCTP deaminase
VGRPDVTQLPDWQIRERIASGEIGLSPYDPGLVQPASIDVRLGDRFRTEHGLETVASEAYPEVLYQRQAILGHTLERLTLPKDIAARVEGKSTIGRQFLMIHVSAGFVDPGFDGQLTLELVNLSGLRQIQLRPGMLIAQISFHLLAAPAEYPYGSPELGSHYQHQEGPVGPYKEGRNGSPT